MKWTGKLALVMGGAVLWLCVEKIVVSLAAGGPVRVIDWVFLAGNLAAILAVCTTRQNQP